MQRRLTRQQLYALAWERPMTRLAREFGLSDVALHKICRRNRVPTPPPGYWAKKAFGKPARIKPLPDPNDASEIVIRQGTAFNEPTSMAEARALVLATLADPTDPVEITPNPIIDRTLAKLSNARPRADGIVRIENPGMAKIAVRPDSVERLKDLLAVLAADAAKVGVELRRGARAAEWSCEGESIVFEIVEAADKVEHVATDKELAAVAKWRREREERHRRYGYWDDWGEPKIPKWEYRHQGRLMVRLENVRLKSERSPWGDPIRHSFAETRNRKIDKFIPAIFSAVAAIGQAKRSNAEFEAREREAAAERARKWAEEERKRVAEARALQFLDSLSEELQAADRLRALLNTLGQQDLGPQAERLVRWAQRRLEAMDDRLSGDVLEQRLAPTDLSALEGSSDLAEP